MARRKGPTSWGKSKGALVDDCVETICVILTGGDDSASPAAVDKDAHKRGATFAGGSVPRESPRPFGVAGQFGVEEGGDRFFTPRQHCGRDDGTGGGTVLLGRNLDAFEGMP